MGQDENSQYTQLTLHIASEFFLEHNSKDVRLLIACCIADIFRIFAPDAPYKDGRQLKVGGGRGGGDCSSKICFAKLYKLELRPILPAVTPLALLALWLAFPAVTPQHCYDAPPTNGKPCDRRPQGLHAKFHGMHLKLAVTYKI